jgi:hypothetical protein
MQFDFRELLKVVRVETFQVNHGWRLDPSP